MAVTVRPPKRDGFVGRQDAQVRRQRGVREEDAPDLEDGDACPALP